MSAIPVVRSAIVALLAVPCLIGAASLSGKVINVDGTSRSGVVVSLSGTSLVATTGSDGTWSLSGTTGVMRGSASPTSPSRHLGLREGRLRVVLSGRDVSGRSEHVAPVIHSPLQSASARALVGTPDTLIYRWDGKVFLRDTLSYLEQSGIVRRFDTTWNSAITYGYMNDAAGQVYRTVRIGSQVWMAENLNHKADSSWWYDGSADSGAKYGRLYTWAAAMTLPVSCDSASCASQVLSKHQGVCPSGWHVPSDSDWSILADSIGGGTTAGKELQSKNGWAFNGVSGNGTDAYGFRAMPAGERLHGGIFQVVGSYAFFWSSTEFDAESARYRDLYSGHAQLYRSYNMKNSGRSVRCLKDAP